MKKTTIINFKAKVWQGRSTVNDVLLITLAMSKKELKQFSKLLECKQPGMELEVSVMPIGVIQASKANDGNKRRVQRYPYK